MTFPVIIVLKYWTLPHRGHGADDLIAAGEKQI